MGKYNITSASQLIDKGTIIAGCNNLKKAAEDLQKAGEKVKSTAKLCTKEAMEVEGQSYEPIIAEVGKEVTNGYKDMVSQADAIIAEANRVYSEQNAELKAYIRAQQEKNQV